MGQRENEKTTPPPEERSQEVAEMEETEDTAGIFGDDPQCRADLLNIRLYESESERERIAELLKKNQADLVNFKRRTEEEQREREKYASFRLIAKLLVVLDGFDRAMEQAPQSEEKSSWLEGVNLILRGFHSILTAEGVRKIEAKGIKFDPSFHESMTYRECEDREEDEVVEVLCEGYLMHDRVIRPAAVILAKLPQNTTLEQNQEGQERDQGNDPVTEKEE